MWRATYPFSGDLFVFISGTFARLDADTLAIKAWYRHGSYTVAQMLVFGGQYLRPHVQRERQPCLRYHARSTRRTRRVRRGLCANPRPTSTFPTTTTQAGE